MSTPSQQEKREAIYKAIHIEFPGSTDFFIDHNACHAAELALTEEQHRLFRTALWEITRPDGSEPIHLSGRTHNRAYASATAEQRTSALFIAITQP